jgi:parvulin-like peptidyl-prolyl isomerase
LAFIGLVAISFAEVESGTKIMAVVGDDVITYNDVQKRYNVIVATNNLEVTTDEEKHVLLRQVLQALINEKIFLQEAKKLKITATEQEINNVINANENNNFFMMFFWLRNRTKSISMNTIFLDNRNVKIKNSIIALELQ